MTTVNYPSSPVWINRRNETAAFVNDNETPICQRGHKEAKRRQTIFFFFFGGIRPQMKSSLWPIYFWPICFGCDRYKRKKKKSTCTLDL